MQPYRVSENEEWTLPREGAAALAVATGNGAIEVSPGDGDTIHVRATKQVRGESEEAARAFLDQMRVERRRDGDRWIVEAVCPRPRPSGIESPEVRLEITAPRGLRLEARSSNGAVHVAGMAEVSLQSSNGEVVARDVAGPCAVRSSNGRVVAEGCVGPVEAHSDNGQLVLRAARYPLRGRTSNGGIDAVLAGDGGVAEVDLSTSNGSIQLTLLHTLSARLEAGTSLGSIHVDTPEGTRTATRGRLETLLGTGEGHVRLRTSNGSIRVQLAEAR